MDSSWSAFSIKKISSSSSLPEIENTISYLHSLSARIKDFFLSLNSIQDTGFSSSDLIHQLLFPPNNEVVYLLQSSQEDKNQYVGCVLLQPLSPSSQKIEEFGLSRWAATAGERRIWFFHTLMLEPSLHSKGVGKWFVQRVLEDLEEGESVTLDCWEGNGKLRAFYRDAGFEEIAILPQEDYWIAVFVWRKGST
ncbi:hypothetical protein BT69DRAFT_1350958 [Atractiella rhizophila]|nr:hypothetical protein BT69DRAFT_1350958 [Atractiella rhizophila]